MAMAVKTALLQIRDHGCENGFPESVTIAVEIALSAASPSFLAIPPYSRRYSRTADISRQSLCMLADVLGLSG